MTAASSTTSRPELQEPAAGRRLALVAVQVALLVALVWRWDLEGRGLAVVTTLAGLGFVLQLVLPEGARQPLFLALSLAGLFLLLDPLAAAWVVGLGVTLVALCHVPVPYGVRVGLVALAGAGLVAGRAGLYPSPWPESVWPMLGALFMFRLVVYLYDLSHEKSPYSPWRSLAYFFLLPNLCFPLFPVVDSKGFRTTWLARAPTAIYQQGADWIFRGVTHLLLYRLVYYHWTLAPGEVESPSQLAQFLLANILLYLRVSGQFHLAVGILKLFGWDLPETNRLYFLASSFNDYWRRINIYWKDFMMKVFYYPAFFRLKRRGKTFALVVATLMVFLLSWGLHSYQWFWLVGDFPVRALDGLFWGAVGLLVLANSLWEDRKGRRRSLRPRTLSARERVVLGLRVAGTFSVICLLWSLWTAETLGEWTTMWRSAFSGRMAGGSTGLAVVAVTLLGLAFAGSAPGSTALGSRIARLAPPQWATTLVISIILLLVSFSGPRSLLGDSAATFVEDLTEARLNRQDFERLERGYYEKLLGPTRLESAFVDLEAPADPQPGDGLAPDGRPDIYEWRDDFLYVTLRPSWTSTYLGHPFQSNRWGMRDQEYDREKPAGAFRIVLLGSSHTMGHGVGNGEMFESRLEARIAAEGLPSTSDRVEILNFAVDDHAALQQQRLLELEAIDFEPDVVTFVAHTTDLRWIRKHLVRVVMDGLPVPYPEIEAWLAEAGVDPSLGEAENDRRIRTVAGPVLHWSYRRIVEIARAHGAKPVWIFFPKLREENRAELEPIHFAAAEEAGFEIVSLSGVWTGHPRRALQVGPTNYHPNPSGHQIVADRLYDLMVEHPETFGLGPR